MTRFLEAETRTHWSLVQVILVFETCIPKLGHKIRCALKVSKAHSKELRNAYIKHSVRFRKVSANLAEKERRVWMSALDFPFGVRRAFAKA